MRDSSYTPGIRKHSLMVQYYQYYAVVVTSVELSLKILECQNGLFYNVASERQGSIL